MKSALTVGVVGGSVTGCAVAALLSRIGCKVTLFERSGEELKDRGAGLGVPPSVIRTYVERDMIDADIPYFPAGSFMRRWPHPDHPQLGYLAWDQPISLMAMNWGMLYRNLRERVPEGCYHTASRVTGLVQSDDHRVRVLLGNGTEQTFDLVVSADGYLSLGRQALFPDVHPVYAGYVLWRGWLNESEFEDPSPLNTSIHCVGHPGGHGIFYFVPNADGSVAAGKRLVNWGLYVPIGHDEIQSFLTDTQGRRHEGSLPPGAMPLPTENRLKDHARARLPAFYASICDKSTQTSVYAIYDCEVPAYRRGRICLAGDAGCFARPHSGAGVLKGMNDAVGLADSLAAHDDVETALSEWDAAATERNTQLLRFGQQLGHALVENIPDWSKMDAASMEKWFTGLVTVPAEIFRGKKAAAG